MVMANLNYIRIATSCINFNRRSNAGSITPNSIFYPFFSKIIFNVNYFRVNLLPRDCPLTFDAQFSVPSFFIN